MSNLKIVTTSLTPLKHLYIKQDVGEDPVLAYKNSRNEVVELNKGGSPESRLLDCSGLYRILSNYFIKGTKFIISTYNPVLYYLFPGTEYDTMFNPSTDFIPTLDIPTLVRKEVDGFSAEGMSQITPIPNPKDPSHPFSPTRSIKACDSWHNNPTEEKAATDKVNETISQIFGYYKEFNDIDWKKESREKQGEYSVDLSETSLTVFPIPDTLYTDTLNLEDWVLKCGKGCSLEAKVDVSYMYSIDNSIYGGMQTLEAFKYSDEGNLIPGNYIIKTGDIQIEYIDWVLKIYPINSNVNEVVFNDCTLTIGV